MAIEKSIRHARLPVIIVAPYPWEINTFPTTQSDEFRSCLVSVPVGGDHLRGEVY